jgi:hypothetical protein
MQRKRQDLSDEANQTKRGDEVSRQIRLSDDQSRVLAEVAGAHGTTSEQVLAEVIEELSHPSGDGGEDTATMSAARRILLRLRSQLPPLLVDVTLPNIEPEELIRTLARALHMSEGEMRARTEVASGNAYEADDWFRHLGMTEEEIADSARKTEANFPSNRPTSESAPMAEHADPR